jgi:hypothetical protein
VVCPAASLVAVIVEAADDDERIIGGGRATPDHALRARGLGAADGAVASVSHVPDDSADMMRSI